MKKDCGDGKMGMAKMGAKGAGTMKGRKNGLPSMKTKDPADKKKSGPMQGTRGTSKNAKY